MKTQITTLLVAGFVSLMTGCSHGGEQPEAKVGVQVENEHGVPVEGATVRIGFTDRQHVTLPKMLCGKTDIAGKFVGKGYSDIMLYANIRDEGFYMSSVGLMFTNTLDGKWLPWDATLVGILRPIGKPVALYVKKVQTDIPALGKPCGYDLEVGDWVAPYGKGLQKDLIFTVINRNVTDTQNFEMNGELTFSSPKDGIVNSPMSSEGADSIFKWERLAPENKYQSKYPFFYSWGESLHQKIVRSFKFGNNEWEGYFFRVRTVEQNGVIVSAHYGKIRGGIEVDPRWSPTCTVAFTYYYNPTPNDRNLEWDTTRNLFKDPGELGAIKYP